MTPAERFFQSFHEGESLDACRWAAIAEDRRKHSAGEITCQMRGGQRVSINAPVREPGP